MNNQTILNETLKRYRCEGTLGSDGRIMQAVLEAMDIARGINIIPGNIRRSADIHELRNRVKHGQAEHPEFEKIRKKLKALEKKTLRSHALDFVEQNGPSTSTQIKKFMYEMTHPGETYNTHENRGWYCSYFSDHMPYSQAHRKPAMFNRPSPNDNRVLFKNNNGTFRVIEEC